MEKLAVSRSSGGGAKLCTLDMQAYLEVMGRQLDEIQAQHQQFYASRQDRAGKLRYQDHPGHLAKPWSSEFRGVPLQPGALPLLPQAPLGVDSFGTTEQAQEGTPLVGNSSTVNRPNSTSQTGARRSLLFANTPAPARCVYGSDYNAPGQSPARGTTAQPQPNLLAVNSTPTRFNGFQRESRNTDVVAFARTVDTERSVKLPYVPLAVQACAGAAQKDVESLASSELLSGSASITPSASAIGPGPHDTAKPQSSVGQLRGRIVLEPSGYGSASSTHSSPLGAYADCEASGSNSISCATTKCHDEECPLTASLTGSFQGAWCKTNVAVISPSPGVSASHGAAAFSSSSNSTSSVLMAEHMLGVGTAVEAMSEGDVSPFTLALQGIPYDGIDSEEDEHPAVTSDDISSQHIVAAVVEAPASAGCSMMSTHHTKQLGDKGSGQVLRQEESQSHEMGALSNNSPQSCLVERAPLVVASLKTEEALLALLSSPRHALNGTVAASIDVEGLEIPADVLAALARTDGLDLDIALGAAMGLSCRNDALREQSRSWVARAASQHTGTNNYTQQGLGRHMLLVPGALTAAPMTMLASTSSRGFNTTTHSPCGSNGRASHVAGCAATAVAVPREAGDSHMQADRPIPAADASIVIERPGTLAHTLDISIVGGMLSTGLRNVAGCTTMVAAQVAAAQQHPQPVLYSLAPKSSAPDDSGSQRKSLDGGDKHVGLEGNSRRVTVDGSSRRDTTDGCGLLGEYLGAGQEQGVGQMGMNCTSIVASATPTGTGASSHPVGFELRTLSTWPSAVTSELAVRGSKTFDAVASPARVSRGDSYTASLSAAGGGTRLGGDGDMVLYGSPSQKADACLTPNVAASQFGLRSPPPIANVHPRLGSPTTHKLSSRLHNSSRSLGVMVTGAPQDSQAGRRAHVEMDEVGATHGAAVQGLMSPWSAVSGSQSSNKRDLPHSVASGMPIGAPNSTHLDLSLTQAAAALAASISSKPSAPGIQQQQLGTATLSPVVSQRQVRTPGLQLVPGLQKQQPNQQGPLSVETQQPPIYSSSSLSGSSPLSRILAHLASHDLEVDESGRAAPPSPAGKDTALAVSPSPEPCLSADGQRNSKTQLQPVGLPMAAFSRAAALAAAADVGMAAPPSAAERRPALTVARWPVQRDPPTDAVVPEPSSSGDTRGKSGKPLLGERHDAVASGSCSGVLTQPQCQSKHEEATPVQEGTVFRAAHGHLEHAEIVQGQSPWPASVASNAVKLLQLKARRQQQWQSQHGLQGNQPLPAPAATPQTQQPRAVQQGHQPSGTQTSHNSALKGTSIKHRDSSSSGCSGPTEAAVQFASGSHDAGTIDTKAAARSPLVAAVGSPPRPGAVAEAITCEARSKHDASVCGELNLGHGVSGLSVAIETGEVKWAWQTDASSSHGTQRRIAIAEGTLSPGGVGGKSHVSSPWSSPAAANASIRDSSAEWALNQLPPPHWQRHGQLPAGLYPLKEDELQKWADETPPVLLPRQQGAQNRDVRRHSEHSVVNCQLEDAGVATRLHYAVSAGGVLAQEQPQLRVPSATEGGGQLKSKAMALLRLKQQSIMRHNVKQSDETDGEQQALLEPSQVQDLQRKRANSEGYHQMEQQPYEQQLMPPLRRMSAAAHGQYASEQAQDRRQPSLRRAPEPLDTEDGEGDVPTSQVHPKPFLRRRSAKVQARKVDWSYVQPRTNSRNPDYYCDQVGPEALEKAGGSPLTAPTGGVAKPPLNLNLSARGKKPAIKLSHTPTEDDRPLSGAPARRRLSNIPPVPGGMPFTKRPAGERRASGRRGGSDETLSPLDDLLAHVNTLLRDFDKAIL